MRTGGFNVLISKRNRCFLLKREQFARRRLTCGYNSLCESVKLHGHHLLYFELHWVTTMTNTQVHCYVAISMFPEQNQASTPLKNRRKMCFCVRSYLLPAVVNHAKWHASLYLVDVNNFRPYIIYHCPQDG